jgi:hypothetical protein
MTINVIFVVLSQLKILNIPVSNAKIMIYVQNAMKIKGINTGIFILKNRMEEKNSKN